MTKGTSWEHMSVSQYKNFCKCPACQMARLRGEWTDDDTEALMAGRYVDAMLTGDPESYIEENSRELFKRNGEPYAWVLKADYAVEAVKKQPLMMHLLSGEHQVEMEAEIEGVNTLIRMDSYKEGEVIADLKYVRDFKSPNLFQNIIDYYGYDMQGAVYQEVVFQKTGKRLPFYLVMVTKHEYPRVAVVEIPQEQLTDKIMEYRTRVQYFDKIKKGEIEAERCEDCDYCAMTTQLVEPIQAPELGKSKEELKRMKGVFT